MPERGWKDELVRVCDACFAGNDAGEKLLYRLHTSLPTCALLVGLPGFFSHLHAQLVLVFCFCLFCFVFILLFCFGLGVGGGHLTHQLWNKVLKTLEE